jgi:2-polyprenyl-3-methyl-5-hydroxy-6-metoxy-1,4-benzoquinol methylase
MPSFEFPGRYYEIMRRDFRDLAAETAFLASYLPDPGRVLDLGSGTGTNLRELSKLGHSGVGVDASASFTEFARNAGGANLEYHYATTAEFSTDEKFDIVLSLFMTLNYLPRAELPELLARIRGWLRPGGHVVLDAGQLLNFADAFQPYQIAHHADGDVLLTRLVTQRTHPHSASWRHEETLLAQEGDGPARMFRNVMDQSVLTTPELTALVEAAGLQVTGVFGGFAKVPPSPAGRGPLVLVAQAAGDAGSR